MSVSKIQTFDKDKTPNGWMIPLYKKTDELFKDYDLNFIYASAILPGAVKGPHLHLKRECRLLVISGEIVVVVRRGGLYEEVVASGDSPSFVIIEPGSPFCVKNCGNKEAIILNLANHIWTEDDKDNHQVTDWHFNLG